MINDFEFEILAELHGLSINKNNNNYLDPKTKLAHVFYCARQDEIDKLNHDLKNEQCASKILSDVVRMYESKEAIKWIR